MKRQDLSDVGTRSAANGAFQIIDPLPAVVFHLVSQLVFSAVGAPLILYPFYYVALALGSGITNLPQDGEQDVVVDLPIEISERMDIRATVSTPIIAGMVTGPFNAALNLRDVRFHIPASNAASRLCFTAVSRDGAYTATVAGEPFPVPKGARAVRPPLKSVDVQRSYRTEDLALRARLGQDCRVNPSAPFLPASYGGRAETLTVMIQSRRAPRITATLMDSGGASVAGTCHSDTNRSSVRFDTLCRFSLAGVARQGTSRLRIAMINRLGREQVEHAVIAWP